MKFRNFVLFFAVLTLISGVSAQPASDLLGSQLSVGESLVEFVNTYTTFDLDSPSEVVLFVIAPLIGYYFLIKNFLAMGYDTFEERIDRPHHERTEDLPDGFGGFAWVVSIITVFTLGMFGAGLLMFIGIASLLLGILMFANLFADRRDNEANQQTTNQQPTTNNTNNGGRANTATGNQPNNDNGGQQSSTDWSDLFDSIGDAFNAANDFNQSRQQRIQQQNLDRLKESLKYFDNDIISEIEDIQNEIGTMNALLQAAESEYISGDFSPDKFKNVVRRVGNLHGTIYRYHAATEEDFSGSGSTDWTDSNCELKSAHSSVSPKIHEQAELINNQLSGIKDDTHINPPDDSLREFMEHHLDDLVAVGHFMAECPYSLDDIANSRDKAEEVYDVASHMGKMGNHPGTDEIRTIRNLCSYLSTNSNPKQLIRDAEELFKKEMKLEESQIDYLERYIDTNGEIMDIAQEVKNRVSGYSNLGANIGGQIDAMENLLSQSMNKASMMKSEASRHGSFESESYKVLKKAESKI